MNLTVINAKNDEPITWSVGLQYEYHDMRHVIFLFVQDVYRHVFHDFEVNDRVSQFSLLEKPLGG